MTQIPVALPALLRSRQVAALLGVSRSTLHEWSCSDPRIARCIHRRTRRSTWWLTARLIEAGLAPRSAVDAVSTAAPIAWTPTP